MAVGGQDAHPGPHQAQAGVAVFPTAAARGLAGRVIDDIGLVVDTVAIKVDAPDGDAVHPGGAVDAHQRAGRLAGHGPARQCQFQRHEQLVGVYYHVAVEDLAALAVQGREDHGQAQRGDNLALRAAGIDHDILDDEAAVFVEPRPLPGREIANCARGDTRVGHVQLGVGRDGIGQAAVHGQRHVAHAAGRMHQAGQAIVGLQPVIGVIAHVVVGRNQEFVDAVAAERQIGQTEAAVGPQASQLAVDGNPVQAGIGQTTGRANHIDGVPDTITVVYRLQADGCRRVDEAGTGHVHEETDDAQGRGLVIMKGLDLKRMLPLGQVVEPHRTPVSVGRGPAAFVEIVGILDILAELAVEQATPGDKHVIEGDERIDRVGQHQLRRVSGVGQVQFAAVPQTAATRLASQRQAQQMVAGRHRQVMEEATVFDAVRGHVDGAEQVDGTTLDQLQAGAQGLDARLAELEAQAGLVVGQAQQVELFEAKADGGVRIARSIGIRQAPDQIFDDRFGIHLTGVAQTQRAVVFAQGRQQVIIEQRRPAVAVQLEAGAAQRYAILASQQGVNFHIDEHGVGGIVRRANRHIDTVLIIAILDGTHEGGERYGHGGGGSRAWQLGVRQAAEIIAGVEIEGLVLHRQAGQADQIVKDQRQAATIIQAQAGPSRLAGADSAQLPGRGVLVDEILGQDDSALDRAIGGVAVLEPYRQGSIERFGAG